MSNKFSLGREERLKSNLRIQDLIKNGHTISQFPLKIYWSISEHHQQKYPVRMAVSVPKRKFKGAVDRNLIKRRIKEAYRLNKSIIYEPLREKNIKLSLLILFLSDEFISFDNLEAGISDLLSKLSNNLPQNT